MVWGREEEHNRKVENRDSLLSIVYVCECAHIYVNEKNVNMCTMCICIQRGVSIRI